MSAHRYGVVLFDFDHTLLDSDASLAGAYDVTMRGVGVDDPSAVYPIFDQINRSLWLRVEAHELSPNEVRVRRFEQLIDRLGLDADADSMASAFVDGLVDCGELLPGAQTLLDDLAGEHRLALVTNGIGSVQRGRLARLGIDRYFETVTISGEVGVNKPGAEIFDLTFDDMVVTDRDDVVMVGDNLGSDVLGGINAGIDTIWFNPGRVEAGDPVPTHTVATLMEVSPLVR